MLSKRRTQPLCRRRQIAMHVAREMTGRSLPIIGREMGGRDHTTILHGVRTVEDLLDAGDAGTVAAVEAIKELLQGTGGAHDGN
jgi:chromosomal replication initiator protein